MTDATTLSPAADSPTPATDPQAAPAPPAPAPDVEIEFLQSDGLAEVFEKHGLSLVVSTYQAGKLLVLRADGGTLNVHARNSRKPMGVALDEGALAVGTLGEIVFYYDTKDNCRKLKPPDKHDACFVPRMRHITGEIDIHEMAFGAGGQPWFINTRFSALCTLNGSNSFFPVWRPGFISGYAPEDRCHLNGLALVNGEPHYVTALGESDQPQGWRDHKADGGVLIDITTNRTLCRGLSMPHSPRWYADHLWVCESGKGHLSKVNPATGELTPTFEFPGFTRGVDFFGPLAFVGLSQIRETAVFSGIPIAEKAQARNCGVWIVDITNGKGVGVLQFTKGVQEIFAVQALPGLRYPEILEPNDALALETYFLPPDIVRQEVRMSAPVKRAYGDDPEPQVRAVAMPEVGGQGRPYDA